MFEVAIDLIFEFILDQRLLFILAFKPKDFKLKQFIVVELLSLMSIIEFRLPMDQRRL